MKALRLAVAVIAAVAFASLSAMVARAEAPAPTIIGAIPVAFEYTHDSEDPDPKEASPSGVRVHFITPYYVGIGVAQYKSALKAQNGYEAILADDLETTYKLIEVSLNYKLGPVLLTWGYGSGKITYSPESIGIPSTVITVKRKESDVIERFIGLGVLVSPNWSIQAAMHLLYAEMEQEFKAGGVTYGTSRDDLGVIMTTVGVGYSF